MLQVISKPNIYIAVLCLQIIFGLFLNGCSRNCNKEFQVLSPNENLWVDYNVGERITYITESGRFDTMIVNFITDDLRSERIDREATEIEIDGTCYKIFPRSGSIEMVLSGFNVNVNWTKDNRSVLAGTLLPLYWKENDMNDSFMVGLVINKSRFLIYNSATKYYDSLMFRNSVLNQVYEYKLQDSAAVFEPDECRRVMLTPKQGIVYIEMRDGRTWLKADLSAEQ